MNPGGKGANQAVAAAKLGGEVTFIAKVGDDIFGKESLIGFQALGIDTSHIRIDQENPSGVALIMVDGKGENSISVALGANANMKVTDIDTAQEVISQASYLLIQLEIPMEVVKRSVELGQELGTPIVLNPAPAQELSDELLASLHIITPNETEAELLTGIKVEDEISAKYAAESLRNKGVEIVIITLGSKGAYVLSDNDDELVTSQKVEAVDTTAAGDTFNGALVVGLSEGMSLIDAVKFANRAAAFSVTKMGAQSSTPNRNEIS
jgi:ribokinase